MADPQLEIRVHIKNEQKLPAHDQFQNMYQGLAFIQADPNLSQFHQEVALLESDLQAQQTFFRANTPPDVGTMAKYAALIQRVQPILATQPKPPGQPPANARNLPLNLNLSGVKPPGQQTMQQRLQNANINPPTFQNFLPPMGGGAPAPPGGGRGRGGLGALPQDIQQFAQQYQAELQQIGQEVFTRLEQQTLSDQMREQAINRLREIRDQASRQALRFPMVSPPRAAIRDIERGASEMHRRLSGQASQLGFAGAERSTFDTDVRSPLQNLIRQGVAGQAISLEDLEDARRAAEMRRGEIRSNPDLDPSLVRRRSEAIAQDIRQASQLARLFPEQVQRGTPGRDLAAVSPGAVQGFENLQAIRQQIVGTGTGRLGQLTSTQQRELVAELNVQQQLLRVEQERLRAEGLMTRERQHRFNVLQNEFRLTERDISERPTRMMPGDIARQAAMIGPTAMIGQALQRIAFERGDERQTSGLAAMGQLISQRGFMGAALGGLQYAGSRAATSLLPSSMASGGLGQLIGGLGAAAPVMGLGMITGAGALLLSQMNAVTGLGVGATSLWRRGAGRDGQGLGNNFLDQNGFLFDLMHQGEGLGFSRDQTLGVANALAERGGLGGSGAGPLAARVGGVLRMSRFLGLNEGTAAQAVGTMEQMNLVGTGENRLNMDQFAGVLAQAIERGNMRGRESELLGAITNLTQEFAVRGMTTPGMTTATIGLLTQMNQTGSPGLRGQFGAQLVGQMDQSIVGARGVQQALLYQAYNASTPGGMNYLQFLEAQGQGMGNPLGLQAFNRIAQLGGEGEQNATRRAYILTNQFFGGNLAMMGRARQLDELRVQGRLTPEALAAGVQGDMESALRPGATQGEGLLGLEHLQDNLNSMTNAIQDSASTFAPLMAGLTDALRGLMGSINDLLNATTNSNQGANQAPIEPKIPTPVGDIPLPPIYPNIQTPIPGVTIPNPLHPGNESPITVTPHPTTIPTPFGTIEIPDIQIGARPVAGPRTAPEGAPTVPALTGRSTLAALGATGATGVGFRLSNLTAGRFGNDAVQALQGQRELMIPRNNGNPNDPNTDSQELVDAFNAAFPNADSEIPPYEELVAFYTNWVAQNQGSIAQAKGIAQAHLQGLEQRWAGVRYRSEVDPNRQHRNAPTLAEVRARAGASDCSGFVSQVYRELGITGLPTGYNPVTNEYRPAAVGDRRPGSIGARYVPREERRPGDAVVSAGTGDNAHMGIYIGNDQVAHMNYRTNGVEVTSLDRFMTMGTDMQFRRISGLENAGGPAINVQEALQGLGILGLQNSPLEDAMSGGPAASSGAMRGMFDTQALSRNPDENKQRVINEAMRIDPTGRLARLALTTIPAEGGFVDPRRVQIGFSRGDNRGGRGMYQFDFGGELKGYRNFLQEIGMIGGNVTTADLDTDRYAHVWTPELQTQYFARYGQYRQLPNSPDAETLARVAARSQRPRAYLDDVAAGRPAPGARIYRPYAGDAAGADLTPPESYTPMDQDTLASSGTLNIALQPATITLQWPDGTIAGMAQINGDVDQVGHTDVNAYRTMGYYGAA